MDLRVLNVSLAVGWLLVLVGGIVVNPGWGIAIAGGLLLVLTLIGAYLFGVKAPGKPAGEAEAD